MLSLKGIKPDIRAFIKETKKENFTKKKAQL